MTSLYVQVEHYSTGLYIQINKFLLKIIDLQYFPKETSRTEGISLSAGHYSNAPCRVRTGNKHKHPASELLQCLANGTEQQRFPGFKAGKCGTGPVETGIVAWFEFFAGGTGGSLAATLNNIKELKAHDRQADALIRAEKGASTPRYREANQAFIQYAGLDASLALARENLHLRNKAFIEGFSTSVERVDAELFVGAVRMQQSAAAIAGHSSLCDNRQTVHSKKGVSDETMAIYKALCAYLAVAFTIYRFGACPTK